MDKGQIAFVSYIVAALITFGPATVESEKNFKERLQECLERKTPDCGVYDPTAPSMQGMVKAIAWPMWWSYKAAQLLMEESK